MEQTVPEILAAVSRELGRLAELSSALQGHLSVREYESRDVEGLQNLDLLHQTLSCLATYVADIATSLPCQCRIVIDRAVGDISLTALANRLRGEVPQPTAAESVEPELF